MTGDAIEVLRDFILDMTSMTGQKPVMLGLPSPFYDLVHRLLNKEARYKVLPGGLALELDGVCLFAVDATPDGSAQTDDRHGRDGARGCSTRGALQGRHRGRSSRMAEPRHEGEPRCVLRCAQAGHRRAHALLRPRTGIAYVKTRRF